MKQRQAVAVKRHPDSMHHWLELGPSCTQYGIGESWPMDPMEQSIRSEETHSESAARWDWFRQSWVGPAVSPMPLVEPMLAQAQVESTFSEWIPRSLKISVGDGP